MIDETEESISTLIEDADNLYLSYPIKKRNGKFRWIDAPLSPLIDIQRKILYKILYKFKQHKCCVGFTKNKSVRDGANIHLGSKALLTMDLQNFFNNIKTPAIYGLLDHMAYKFRLTSKSKKDRIEMDELQKIARVLTFKGQVPQGAPTSPALANLVAYKLDMALEKLAMENGCTYTRYADDLAFSNTDQHFNIGSLISKVKKAIESKGFALNYKKTKIRRPHNRMTVTGVVINDKLTVPRWKWRNFRAQLHNLKMENTSISLEQYQQLRGYAEWIRSLHPTRGQQFITELGKIPLVT